MPCSKFSVREDADPTCLIDFRLHIVTLAEAECSRSPRSISRHRQSRDPSPDRVGCSNAHQGRSRSYSLWPTAHLHWVGEPSILARRGAEQSSIAHRSPPPLLRCVVTPDERVVANENSVSRSVYAKRPPQHAHLIREHSVASIFRRAECCLPIQACGSEAGFRLLHGDVGV